MQKSREQEIVEIAGAEFHGFADGMKYVVFEDPVSGLMEWVRRHSLEGDAITSIRFVQSRIENLRGARCC